MFEALASALLFAQAAAPVSLPEGLGQFAEVAAIISAVIYLRRAEMGHTNAMLDTLLPVLDVREQVARLEGKVDTLMGQDSADNGRDSKPGLHAVGSD